MLKIDGLEWKWVILGERSLGIVSVDGASVCL